MSFLHGLNISQNEKNFLDKYGFVIRRHEVINRSIDFHWHDYFELEIVTGGTGLHFIGGKSFSVSSGDGFLLSPADMHAMTGYDDFCILNICFLSSLLPEKITDFILAGGNRQCRFSEEELAHILYQTEKINKIASEFAFKKELVTNIISEIILLILEKTSSDNGNKNSSLTQRAISLMMKDFKKDITLKSISKELSVTPKHLGFVFKQNTGASFHEYLNSLRLKFACGLLLSSSLSVKETAFASGYNSVEHFLYVFKKQLKTTPAEFRQHKNNSTE